jgi:hypothetical protein
MPGPAPKHASVRARTNKASTASTLRLVHDVKTPELPPGDWNDMTRAWWTDIWASPMAPEFDESDRHGLFILAALVDGFWTATGKDRKDLAGEIRLQRQCFGLTPMDRRRLQWEIEKADEAQERGQRRRSAAPKAVSKADDPRAVLGA